jgi:hypothetical protein
VGSIPDLKPGDWLEHEALDDHSRRRRRPRKLAEVGTLSISTNSVGLYLQDEPGLHTVTRAEVLRWWNVFDPKIETDDIVAPHWIQKGKVFRVDALPETRATIYTIHGSWISYIEDCPDYSEVFRLMPYRTFRDVGWDAKHRPSVWDWLRQPLV